MPETLTIQLPKPLAEWLKETSARTGRTEQAIVRSQLQKAKSETKPARDFMRLAGAKSGPRDLSLRKGYSRRA